MNKEIKNEKILQIVDKILYLKICWNQAVGNLTMPIQIFDKAILIAVLLKVYNITNYWLIGISGFILVIIVFIVGHIILSRGVLKREMSIQNYYNPELQKILQQTGGKCRHCGKVL